MPPLILVVDDDANVLRAMCRMLAFEGYRCLPTTDAGRALELLDPGRMPDLLLFDVRLSDMSMSGPQLALHIHERHPGIPVLFVSGWPEDLVNPDTLTPLRWEFLPKPFEPEVLVDRVQRLLKRSQAALGGALE